MAHPLRVLIPVLATLLLLGVPFLRVELGAPDASVLPRDVPSRRGFDLLRGGLTNEFYRLPNLKQNTILVRYEEKDRKDLGDLENLYISAADGRQVAALPTDRRQRGPQASRGQSRHRGAGQGAG